MYRTGWGLADWTNCDRDWECADQCLSTSRRVHQHMWYPTWFYHTYFYTHAERAADYNTYAISLGRFDRWAVTPDDLRLANCATIIKRAYRRASNDPSYRMCRARIMPPPEEFHALCSAM